MCADTSTSLYVEHIYTHLYIYISLYAIGYVQHINHTFIVYSTLYARRRYTYIHKYMYYDIW